MDTIYQAMLCCKSLYFRIKWWFIFMPYYGLVLRDLHILDFWWRLPLCTLPFVEITTVHTFCDYPCAHYILWLPLCILLLCSMTHHDITMGNNIARDAHCNITMGNNISRDAHCSDITMHNDIVRDTNCDITMGNNIARDTHWHNNK